jgi:hypothetical protein
VTGGRGAGRQNLAAVHDWRRGDVEHEPLVASPSSAIGVHGELLPVTACRRPTSRPGAARSTPLHGFIYASLVSLGEMPCVLFFTCLPSACVCAL